MGAATTAALALADPAEQKKRLKQRIIAVFAGSTPVAEWVAGSAANLVVYHGVPLQDMEAILCDVAAMRDAGNLRHAGRFFCSKVLELANRLGKPWPHKR